MIFLRDVILINVYLVTLHCIVLPLALLLKTYYLSEASVYCPLSALNNEETFLQDFQERKKFPEYLEEIFPRYNYATYNHTVL